MAYFNLIKIYLVILYYKLRFNITLRGSETLMPKTGKDTYVSIYNKGKIIQIIDEQLDYGEIRIIPYTPNCGVMIENWKDGKLKWRNILSIHKLCNEYIYADNLTAMIFNASQNERIKLKK